MRGLVRFSVCVLLLVCMFTICNADKLRGYVVVNPNWKWAKQSGQFAATILNVKWYGNNKHGTYGKLPQNNSGGRYTVYRIFFKGVRYSDHKKVQCHAQVYWPRPDRFRWAKDNPATTRVHLMKHKNFMPRCWLSKIWPKN